MLASESISDIPGAKYGHDVQLGIRTTTDFEVE